ncbi:MAG: neutral/alkaline non-lysosomal ceramidase N-terminal domain-containing protein [Planctomycetaceae bacterium]|nr:neutral/alkaline non-lysosomal ceramidase N-terminal domain-containing protein [Planctomycetaceae bacterium]
MIFKHRSRPINPLILFGIVLITVDCGGSLTHPISAAEPETPTELQVGLAETDITPPVGFPMAGYYHERLAEGAIDPLKAKAIVFREGETAAALVVCDLIGIATDLSREVRKAASKKTGIPASHIVISATHSHTAPDYMKELYLYLGGEEQEQLRSEYIKKLIAGPVDAIVRANANASPSQLSTGSATQTTDVSFNRRFVMRDGSVRTWQNYRNPDVIRAAGPIDPAIELLMITGAEDDKPKGFLSNFALHLDTVGGTKWSADYPYFIEQTLREKFDPELISIFGTGCCGDINHSDPSRTERNKCDFIGSSLGNSIIDQLDQLKPVTTTSLFVKSTVVELPLQDAPRIEVERSVELLKLVKGGQKIDFFDHVAAYKLLILDQFHRAEPYAQTAEQITWGLSRSLAGIGENLPVDVTVITIGSDLAIVCLPGEVFVDLGLAIKRASPFRTTMVIELSNAVETIYIPHRAAYAGGSYEVTNSAVQPGSGEILVERALTLLRNAATQASANSP